MQKTIVYNGEQPIFNLTKPMGISFPKGVPITIDERLMDYLPYGEFKEYKKDGKVKIDPSTKPILIRLPSNVTDILACVKAMHKLRDYYPETPIHAITRKQYAPLFQDIDNLEILETYKVAPLKYYKQLNTRIFKDSPVFNGGALKIHTREFCFLQHLKLMDGDNPKKPTLLNIKTDPQNLTILNTGTSMNSVWGDMGDYLIKQEWGLPVTAMTKEETIPNAIEIIRKSKYVIATGDTPLVYLAAYLGVPLFVFLRETNSLLSWQLHMFNNLKPNQVIYSPFILQKEPAFIFEKLSGLVSDVITGSPVKDVKPNRVPLSVSPQPAPAPRRRRRAKKSGPPISESQTG